MMSNLLIFIACSVSWVTDFYLLADLGHKGGLL